MGEITAVNIAQQDLAETLDPSNPFTDAFNAVQENIRLEDEARIAELKAQLALEAEKADSIGSMAIKTPEAPTSEAPTSEAPTSEAPMSEAPMSEAPTSEAPTSEAPTSEAPTSSVLPSISNTDASANSPEFNQAVATEKAAKAAGLPGQENAEGVDTTPAYTRAMEQLKAIGYSEELAATMLNPSKDAIIETQSPIEFAAAGAGGALKTAGVKAASIFLAGSPIEYAGSSMIEEAAGDNYLVGLSLSVLWGIGVGTGANLGSKAALKAGEAIEAKGGKAIKNIVEAQVEKRIRAKASAYAAEQAAKQNPASATNQSKLEALVYEVSKQKTTNASTPGQASKSTVAKEIDAETYDIASEIATPILQEKVVEAETNKLTRKILIGDMRDPETRKIIADTVQNVKAEHDITPEQSAAVKVLETKLAQSPVQYVKQHPQGDNPAFESGQRRLSSAIRNAVHRKVYEEWYGPNEEYLITDIATAVNAEIQRVKASGQRLNLKAIKASVEKEVRDRYAKEAQQEVNDILRRVDPTSFSGLKIRTIQGGLDEPDAKFVTPPGRIDIRVRPGKGQSKYQHFEWDIADHIVWDAGKRNLRLIDEAKPSVTLPKGKEVKVNPNWKSKLLPYGPSLTYNEAQALIKQRAAYWIKGDKRIWPEKGSKIKYPTWPEVDKYKVPIRRYNPKTGKYFTIKSLPEQEVYNIAQMLGWDDSKLAPVSAVDKTGKVWNTLPEDIIKGKEEADSWETLYPGYFEKNAEKAKLLREKPDLSEAEKAAISPPPRYYKMSAAKQAYNKQIEDFIRSVVKIPRPDTATTAKEAAKRKYEYYHMLDKLFMLRKEFIDEIEASIGSPHEGDTKKAYLMLSDWLGGTNKLETANAINRTKIREEAWLEINNPSIANRDVEFTETAIMDYAALHGISFEEAAELYATDVVDTVSAKRNAKIQAIAEEQDISREEAEAILEQQEFERDKYVWDLEDLSDQEAVFGGEEDLYGTFDPSLTGQVSDEAGTSMQIIEAPVNPKTQEPAVRLTNITRADKRLLARQVNNIEDHIGSRIADSLYYPGVEGAPGQINLFKVNKVADIQELLSVFDRPAIAKEIYEIDSGDASTWYRATVGDVVLDDVNPELAFGIKPDGSLDPEVVRRVSHVLNDVQAQTTILAEKLVKHPDDILAAVAFDKARIIHNAFADILRTGTVTETAANELAAMDFSAFDDYSLFNRMAQIVDSNYIYYGKGMADLRRSTVIADFLLSMPDTRKRVNFLAKMNAAEIDIGAKGLTAKLAKTRKILNKRLLEECI